MVSGDRIEKILYHVGRSVATERKIALFLKEGNFMELVVGIEPTACSLRVSCSTSEPH